MGTTLIQGGLEMTTQTKAYPVHLRGELTIPPSRWVWLFKWLLIVPHIFVLFFLTIASVVLTVIAFFAILFTGKYPKSMFDFNVGVMRWGWRVSFYSYSALGTDKYPPFSLDPDPNYPADLEVEYPEKLKNWMVLVKWLLAIPQLIIIGIFQGVRSWGLISILTIVNAIVLLFTGKMIPEVFNLVIGFNRWTYRVNAYVFLMRDEYPPFRLDD
jgi:hypothetical protein